MPQIWFMVDALIALARHRRNGKQTFTRADLRAWSESINARPKAAQHALDHLEASNFVRRCKPLQGDRRVAGQWTYMLTPEGREAAAQIELEHFNKERAIAAMSDTSTFEHRVYTLLRTRRTLSGADAAETLCDAGQDVKSAAQRASKCLSAWSKLFPHAIKRSDKRVAREYRYVMVEDMGPLGAAYASQNKAARGGATA